MTQLLLTPHQSQYVAWRLTSHATYFFNNAGNTALTADVEGRRTELLLEIKQRNLGYFELEVQKLDAWADDLKLGLEHEIKEIDREIKEVRRTAATSPTLEEKLAYQKRQSELFARQDAVESQSNRLIEKLESQLEQRVEEKTLFNVEWGLV